MEGETSRPQDGDDARVKPEAFARATMTELRKAKGWSYSELGRRLSTTPTQVRKLEGGDLNISLSWMQRLARVFEVKMSAFLPPDEIALELDSATSDLLDLTRSLGKPQRRMILTAAREIVALARKLGDDGEAPRLLGDHFVANRLAEQWNNWGAGQRRRAVELLQAAEGLAAE